MSVDSFIGWIVMSEEGGRKVPIFNPGTKQEPWTIVIDSSEPPICGHTLDRYGIKAALRRPGGFKRLLINKVTRNGEATFSAFSFSESVL